MDLSFIDKMMEWERPLQAIQIAAVGASAVASILYLQRWWHINFNILNEQCYYDYKYQHHSLSDLEVLANVDNSDFTDTIKSIVSMTECQLIGAWSSDIFRSESTVLASLQEAKCSVLNLDFRDSVWIESLKAWLSRMYLTSNPVRTILKELVALVREDNTNDGTYDLSEAEVDALFVEFRTLLLEKRDVCQRQQQKHPSRPLVVFVKGLDRMMLVEKKFGVVGKKIIDDFIDHFLGLCNSNIHVVLSFSDQFYVKYWLVNAKLRTRGIPVHIRRPSEDALVQAWLVRAQQAVGSGYTSSAAEAILREIFNTWGTCAYDINRALISLQAKLVPSISSLAESDLRSFVMSWYLSMANSTDSSASDDDEETETSCTGPGVQTQLVQMMAESHQGKISLHSILQQPNGNKLLSHALCMMFDSSNSLLSLHVERSCGKHGGDDGSSKVASSGSTHAGSPSTHAAVTMAAAPTPPNRLNTLCLASFGLYFMPRRPIYHLGLQHIHSTMHAAITTASTVTVTPLPKLR